MLKSGFETDDWSSTLFGEVGRGAEIVIKLVMEVTFSYFSLKRYQVSQGLMAMIEVLFHGGPLATLVNLKPIGMPPVSWDF